MCSSDLACLGALDYSVEWRVINAADYGNAQRRRRVFIFAYHKSTNYYKNSENINALDIINQDGSFAKTFPIEQAKNLIQKEIDSSNIYEISNSFHFPFENSGYMKGGMIYTVKTTPIFETPIAMRELLEKSVDEKYFIKENLDKWKYLKGSKKITRKSRTGHEYTFSEGALSFPDNIDLPARTMLTSESSVNRSSHIIEDPEDGRLRIITPLEAERIQGFDDNWTNTEMPESFRYFCMGNALVVPLITRMGYRLNEIFEKES